MKSTPTALTLTQDYGNIRFNEFNWELVPKTPAGEYFSEEMKNLTQQTKKKPCKQTPCRLHNESLNPVGGEFFSGARRGHSSNISSKSLARPGIIWYPKFSIFTSTNLLTNQRQGDEPTTAPSWAQFPHESQMTWWLRSPSAVGHFHPRTPMRRTRPDCNLWVPWDWKTPVSGGKPTPHVAWQKIFKFTPDLSH